MYPFWESVIEPVIRAAGASRVLEIGALRGENTVRMLEALGADAELHVIDPVPEFDPAEHERQFPGQYVFHRALSLDVLPDLAPVDVALVDGDHNWYTVFNELRLLAESARKASAPLPVLVLHDVGWPYGRRDLYYEPSQIPDEFRQPWERKGMRPGHEKLLPHGGMNAQLANAVVEGGPRNGVMTALEDFMADHDRPLRMVLLPFYFGLAIVVEQDRLDGRPELAALLDELETPEGKDRLIEMSESIRLDAAVFEQNIMRAHTGKIERGAAKYLRLLAGAVLDAHYLDNEARIAHLLDRAARGADVSADVLRDPATNRRQEFDALETSLRTGPPDTTQRYFPFTSMGADRLDHLHRALDTVRTERIRGDLVDCATGRGGAAMYMRGFLKAYEMPAPTVWVADTFRATTRDPRPLAEGGVDDLRGDLGTIRGGFHRLHLLDDRVRFLQGTFEESLPEAPVEAIAVLRIGADAGVEVATILDHLYDRVVPGGFVIVEDLSDPAARTALGEFRARRSIPGTPEKVGSGVAWRRSLDEPPPEQPSASPATEVDQVAAVRRTATIAPAAPKDALDLTVVVVFHNMRREAQRTLHSLSRAYQRGVDDLTYEVIAVDNGSDPDQRLDEDLVAGHGAEFRLLDLGEEAPASPTVALNRGIHAARGRAIALMIDGAHVLSPGVLRFGMTGLRAYEPAVVATQQWYVGPGQQPEAVEDGYDERLEDELFAEIDWPNDGYRLFDISHFIGDRDWLDGFWESNCLFVPRSLLEQVGGFDNSFSMPGGGYANLELLERLVGSPGVTTVSILGEGTFHQVHGGTTTNDASREARRDKVFSYGEHFRELRGRALRSSSEDVHYVGRISTRTAGRTRARMMDAKSFTRRRTGSGPDGVPDTGEIIPDDLTSSFVDAYWKSLAWRGTRWLGEEVATPPTDLVVYQEILSEIRPDWIIEIGANAPGRTRFLASVCDLVGHGRVVSVGNRRHGEAPRHERVVAVEHRAPTAEAVDAVRDLVGEPPNAVVILASGAGAMGMVQEYRAYEPFVPVGSYLIVENTIVNGHPVWPGYGPGPTEAVRRILAVDGSFVADTDRERHALTFNRGGYLRRVR